MTDIEQDEQRDKLFFQIIFDMTMAYLDVLKELDNDPHLFASLAGMESALETVMPYIKAQLADKVRGGDIKDPWPQEQDAYGYEEWFDVGTEYAAQLIERFEL